MIRVHLKYDVEVSPDRIPSWSGSGPEYGLEKGCYMLIPTNFVTLVPKLRRKEGYAVREPLLLWGIAVQQEEAEGAGGCQKRW